MRDLHEASCVTSYMKRFSTECCKSETKVITTTNQEGKYLLRADETSKVKTKKQPKEREGAGDLFVTGFCFGASFLDQLESKVKQNQSSLGFL